MRIFTRYCELHWVLFFFLSCFSSMNSAWLGMILVSCMTFLWCCRWVLLFVSFRNGNHIVCIHIDNNIKPLDRAPFKPGLPTAEWYLILGSAWPSLENYSGSSWDFRGLHVAKYRVEHAPWVFTHHPINVF